MPFRIYVDDDVPSAAEVNRIMQAPVSALVAADDTTTNTSYGNLATLGPTVTNLDLAAGQAVMVSLSCSTLHAGPNDSLTFAYMSFTVTGASGTQAASDTNALSIPTAKLSPLNNIHSPTIQDWYLYVATTNGPHTFQAKYRCGSAAVTMHFYNRRLIVFPKA